jgi:hypothetical protein
VSNQIQVPVLIAGLATKVDGSIKITLETQELTPQASADLFGLRGAMAWAVIAADEMKEVTLPSERPDASIGQKTPGQRLRAVMYRLWEQTGSGVDFESFYRLRMESIIEQLKGKLE